MIRKPLSPNRTKRSIPLVCLSACGLTVILLLIAYAVRGIWPFGTGNVAYVDMVQFYLPNYYNIWDALHSTGSAVNWAPGLIEGLRNNWTVYITPANWAFLFVARDHVLEALSLYLAIKLVIVALICSIVLCLRFPTVSPRWRILLTLLYTLSGFVLQYYSNLNWLWIVAFFPLLLFGLERLLRQGRYLLYGIFYAILLYYSIYYAYMVTLYILLFSFAYIMFILPKSLRGDRAFRLGVTSIAAFAVTARSWIGSSSSLATSSRFQSNMDSGLITGFTTWNITNTRHTVLMLLGMAVVLAIACFGLYRQRLCPPEDRARRRSAIRFFCFVLGMLAIPMIFTNIDTAWHFGQYNFFPMRYGYVIPATLIAAAALVLEEEERSPGPAPSAMDRRCTTLHIIGIVIIAGVLVYLVPKLDAYFISYGSCFLNILGKKGYWRYFALLAGCGLLYVGLYVLLFRLRSHRAATIVLAVCVCVQLCANACGLLGPDDDHTATHEYDQTYVDMADALYDYFSQQDISSLTRAKNVDNSLSAAYPVIAGVSALSSVYSSNSATRLGIFKELGYSINYFRILDTGGTVFSDMLLGVDIILSEADLDETLYTAQTTVDGIQIGTANYPGHIGLMYSIGTLDDYLDLLTIPDRLNALYDAFTSTEEEICYVPDREISAEGDSMKTYTLTCYTEDASFLYMSVDGGVIMSITVDGSSVSVPTYRNTSNTVYPATFNSNLLYLGCSAGEGPVTIQFQSVMPLTEDDITLIAIDKAAMETFYEDANYDMDTVVETGDDTITIQLTAPEEGMRLFLPISYSSRWQCTVNGQAVTLTAPMGVLTGVPLEEGENTIVMQMTSSKFALNGPTILSICSLVLVILWAVFRHFYVKPRDIALPAPIATLSKWLFWLVCAGACAFLYIVPTIYLITQGTIVHF